MKTILITGPSGSGKSYLANKLANHFTDSVVIPTDSYYKDDIFIKLISFFIYDIYDRPISIKRKKIIETANSIYNKDKTTIFYHYDFKTRQSSKTKKKIEYKDKNQFLIIEGIFAHRLNLNNDKTINIVCNEKKDICYQRRLIRDKKVRGRERREVIKKFSRSWNLYFKNSTRYINSNNVTDINPFNQLSLDKLIIGLKSVDLNKKNQEENKILSS
tara:strand:- start:648 stop:1295 length:648 start_codon:yes stop_codon:yes gene_type:complete